MKKVAYLYYRSWSYDILRYLHKIQAERKDFIISDVICPSDNFDDLSFLGPDTSVHLVDPSDSDDLRKILKGSNIELMFCYGWSWLIPDDIVGDCDCICLHPSMLPEYRGGSPIQNQIFDGVLESGVSVIKMNSGVDTGPIYKQVEIHLDGPIEEVFKRITSAGSAISRDLIHDYVNNDLFFYEQDHQRATVVRRRRPSDSIMSLEDISMIDYIFFQRYVNVLRDPYPNLNITVNNFLLKITKIKFLPTLPKTNKLIDNLTYLDITNGCEIYIETADGFSLISQFKIDQL